MRWIAMLGALVVGCSGAGASSGAGSPETAGAASTPAMRYVQDGRPIGVLGADGRVTLEGGEHVATVYGNGQVVDHLGTGIFSVTSSGNVVFAGGSRDPMRLVGGQLAYGPDEVLVIDDAGNFHLGEALVGIFVEGYQPAHAQAAFLGWLALQLAPIPLLRSHAAEAREGLEAQWAAIAAGASPISVTRTPATVPCGDAVVWTPSTAYDALAFGPESTRYAWSVDVEGDALVLRAEGDLDCDGVVSRFELHAHREGEGYAREPLLRVVDELE